MQPQCPYKREAEGHIQQRRRQCDRGGILERYHKSRNISSYEKLEICGKEHVLP